MRGVADVGGWMGPSPWPGAALSLGCIRSVLVRPIRRFVGGWRLGPRLRGMRSAKLNVPHPEIPGLFREAFVKRHTSGSASVVLTKRIKKMAHRAAKRGGASSESSHVPSFGLRGVLKLRSGMEGGRPRSLIFPACNCDRGLKIG